MTLQEIKEFPLINEFTIICLVFIIIFFLYQADVLVGTAAHNLSLNQNPCASALSQAAGQGLQRECDSKSPVSVGNIAVLHQVGRLKCQAVIFAICSEWDSGKGKKVLCL